MATTLIQAGEATEQAYEDLRDEAQDALSKSAEDLRTAQDEHSDLLEDRAGLEKDVADIRTAMLYALMPADVEALADDLRLKQIALRKVRAELLNVKEKVSSLAAALAGAQEQFKEAPRSLAVAQRELADARKRDALHSDWRGAVTAGTPTDLAAEAQAMLDAAAGGPVVVGEDEDVTLLRAAKARTDDVDADIPAALRTRARERAEAVEASMSADAGLLSSVEDSLYQHRQATEGVAGASSRLWYAFEQAEHAFGDLVTHAQTRYDEAVSLLSSIEASAELTAAESARIDAVALTGGDEEALTKEKAVGDAKLTVQAKEIEIELAIAQVLIADIDADAEADSTVSDLRAEPRTAASRARNRRGRAHPGDDRQSRSMGGIGAGPRLGQSRRL